MVRVSLPPCKHDLTYDCGKVPHSSLRITNNNIIQLTSRSPVDRGYEPFFHISIVEGDISLVLDNEALSRYNIFATNIHADISNNNLQCLT